MYYLSLCAIHKFEGFHLREWIEYHLLLGFEHFFLYNNDDESEEVHEALTPYVERGVVESFSISGRFRQLLAYEHCTRLARQRSRWVAFFDLDEFCYPLKTNSVPLILQDYEAYGGLAVNWCCYGTSGLRQRPQLVTAECVYRGPDEFHPNNHVKSIVNPRKIVCWPNPHYPRYEQGYHSVDENFKLVRGAFNIPPTSDKLRLNHYVLRSQEDYALKHKRQRGSTPGDNWYDQDFFKEHDRNEVFDPNRFAPRLADILSSS